MSKKFGRYEVGQTVLFEGKEVTILSKKKGNKTSIPNFHSGWLITGFVSNFPLYTLSNGYSVRGNKLKTK